MNKSTRLLSTFTEAIHYLSIAFLFNFFTITASFAQTWQKTYPQTAGYSIQSLSTGITANLRNGLTNAFFQANFNTGNYIALSPSLNDCDMAPFGGDLRLNAYEFFDYSLTISGDAKLRRVSLTNGNCTTIDQIIFDQTYDLPTTEANSVLSILYDPLQQVVYVGGMQQITPMSSNTQYKYYVIRINAITGDQQWIYTSPTQTVSGTIPGMSLRINTNAGGIIGTAGSFSYSELNLFKLSSAGQLVFANLVGGFLTTLTGIEETGDGSLLIRKFNSGVSGPSDSPSFEKWSTTGTFIYSISPSSVLSSFLGTSQYQLTLGVTVAHPNGDVLLVGKNTGLIGTPGNYLIKANASGTVLWTRFYPGLNVDFTHGLLTLDGGYLLGGNSNNLVYLMRTDAQGQVAPPGTCIGNLITNPGFENDLAGWTTAGTVTVSNTAHFGAKAAKLGGTGYSTVGFIKPSTPGTSYTLSAWGKITGSAYNAMELRFLNAAFTTIPFGGVANFETTDYLEYIITATAPPGTVYVYAIASKDGAGSIEVDDWCLTTGSGGNPCSPDVTPPVLTNCPANINVITPIATAFATWTPPTATDNCGTPVLTSNFQPGFSGFLIGSTPVIYTATDAVGNSVSCSFNVNVSPLNPCTFDVITSNIQCNNNGTASNANDDTFTFTMTVSGPASSPGWYITPAVAGMVLTGSYNTPVTQGPFPISGGAIAANVYPSNYNSPNPCLKSISISPPAPCSGIGTGQIDLSLTLQQLTASPAIYSSYPVKATISNAGPQTATGVKVSFKKPTGVVYTGGNEYVASQGSFTPNGNEEWTVGSIPAGGSATLTVNYFLLQAAAPVAYAQVSAALQTDSDSQPNNGTPPTPVQDDEANTAGGIPNSFCSGNLLLNGDMETTTGWEGINFNFVATDVYQGNSSISVIVPAPNGSPTVGAALQNFVPVVGKQYTLNCFARRKAGSQPSTIPTPSIRIDIYNSSGLSIASDFVSLINETPYQAYTLQVIAPIGATWAQVRLNGGGNTFLLVDNVCLTESTAINPDLTIADLQIPTASVTAGATLSYNFDLSNIGNAAVPGNFNVKSYISTDNILSVNDIQDGNIVTGNFAAGFAINNVPGASTIPANLAAGSYFLIVKVDADGSVTESNENNNVVVKPFTVTGGVALPDLSGAVEEIIPSQDNCYVVPGGGFLVFTIFVFNNGTAPASAFKVKYYISTDNVFSNNDILWSTENIASLNILSNGGPAFSSPSQPIPATLASGLYYVIIKIDADGQVAESNEGNNQVDNILIRVGAPNLIMNSASGIPASIASGGTFNVNAQVSYLTNGFPANSNTQPCTIYLELVPQNSSNIISIGQTSFAMNEFTATGSVSKNIQATIPTSVTASNYTLRVRVSNICESNNIDNIKSYPISVTSGGTPNCNSITITPGQGNITIAGAVAPHVLIKVFRPNWTVAFECLDGACSNPQVVSGLSAGSHFVEIKLFNASWGLICTKTQTVNLNSFGGGNSNLRTAEEEAKMTIDKFYPNPAQHWMNFELYSPKKQETRLDFFDQLGIRVYTLKVELDAGINTIELELSDFKSGIYNVIARGDGQLAYGRFVKIWEE